MSIAQVVIDDARYELMVADRAIKGAVNATDSSCKWSALAEAYEQRARVWREMSKLFDDPMVRKAMVLASSHDVAAARMSLMQRRPTGGRR